MIKRREKVSVKAAAIILGAALLTAGCSGYQSSEELRKNAENVQAEIVPGEENETEMVLTKQSAKKQKEKTRKHLLNRAAIPPQRSSKAKRNAPQPRRRNLKQFPIRSM